MHFRNGHDFGSFRIVAALSESREPRRSASHYVCVFRGIAYFSPAAVEAINENYEVFCSASSSTVLVPRARPVAVTPAAIEAAFGTPCDTGQRGAAPMILFPEGAR